MVNLDQDFEQRISRQVDDLPSSALLDVLPHGIILQDENGHAVYVNQKFTELTGYDMSHLSGLTHSELVCLLIDNAKEIYDGIKSNLDDMNSGTAATALRRFWHRDGYSIPVESCGFPIRDKDGKNHGTLIVCKDLHSELLVKIINTINSSLKLQDVLYNTTKSVVEYLGLSSCAIFLKDPQEDLLRLIACNAFEEDELRNIVFPMGRGAPGIIARDRKTVYVANLGEDTSLDELVRSKHQDKSSIGYPLIFKDELLGVMAFDAETVREFSSKECALFESITRQVALAIYNAQLFAKLEHLSITDGLTGLYNHRYFQDRLLEELNRAKRKDNDVSLLLMDIDHFKNYNDTYGHVQGDELLKGVSRLIKESVRSFDVVCRYGGEEFAVILPDCRLEEARNIGERIRSNCELSSFFGREIQPGGSVTLSLGVSSYPKSSKSEELVLFADRALYRAKRLSRNRIECY